MMDIKYVSGTGGEVIDLSSFPYLLQAENLFDYAWTYDGDAIPGQHGGRITRFTRGIESREINIYIHAETKEEFIEALNAYRKITERDVMNLTPGKLYVGQQYLTCYIYSSSKTKWNEDIRLNIDKTKIVSEYPFWCTDIVRKISENDFIDSGNTFLDHPYDYLYEYKKTSNTFIRNPHFTAADFRMFFYGEAVNPVILLGEHRYEIFTSISEGEYIIVDSKKKTIVKTEKDGTEVNLFNLRNKKSDIFQRIPVGNSSLQLYNLKQCDIVMITERSEPIWSSS